MTTQSEYKRLKRRLAYRRNRLKGTVARFRLDPNSIVKGALVAFDARQVVEEVKYAERIFEDIGFPDLWNMWLVAKRDANIQIQYHTH